MSDVVFKASRRQLFGLCAGLTGILVETATARADTAAAAAPVPALSKASVGYRDVPYDGQVCAACVYFIFKPATGDEIAGRCQLVAGPIAPAGWCQVWQPKG
jgi:hypothetical protein